MKVFIAEYRGKLKNEKGAVAVIAAIMLVVVISLGALVLDIGSLYERRRQVQTAVDGAALAGAQELPDQGMAAGKAIEYLELNGVSNAGNAQIIFPDSMKIKVTAPPQTVNYSLAPVMGFQSSAVDATATAIKEYRFHFVPWALVLSTLTPGQLTGSEMVLLKASAGDQHQGNFQSITVPRSDTTGVAETYQSNIEVGTEMQLAVGQTYDTLTGNRVGPLTDGLTESVPQGLLTQGYDPDRNDYSPPGNDSVAIDTCTLSDVVDASSGEILAPGCPRLVRVPCIAEWPNGHAPVTITELKWFFIEQPPPPTSGQITEVWGYILDLQMTSWPYTIRLVE